MGGQLPQARDEIAEAWADFDEKSGAILWLAVAFFVALCLGGWAVIS